MSHTRDGHTYYTAADLKSEARSAIRGSIRCSIETKPHRMRLADFGVIVNDRPYGILWVNAICPRHGSLVQHTVAL